MTSLPNRRLYHGTTEKRISKYNPVLGSYLEGFSIDLSLCRPRTDFGQGFYLTTSRKQAKNWASNVCHRSSGGDRAALLEFSIDLDALSKLDGLCFVMDTEEFHSFVDECRRGNLAHRRSLTDSPFDVVAGPVTLFPQDVVVADADQFSFHTMDSVSLLSKAKLVELGDFNDGRFRSAYLH